MKKTQQSIQLNDIFWTFQGEGKNWGRRALFIRLPFCNYSCPWCDTDYNSINFKLTDEEFIEWLKKEDAQFAVITGGEPTVNKNFKRIVNILYDQDFEMAIETNGSNYPLEVASKIDLMTVSPKKHAPRDLPEFYIDNEYLYRSSSTPNRVEFKFVVEEGFDFSHVDNIFTKIPKALVSLSPEYNRMDESMKEIENYIIKEPRARYSLQTHKWIDVK